MCASDKLLALGTKSGRVHILGRAVASLPGVRLVTWIILAFINWCFDIQPYQLHDQAGGVEAGGEEHDVVVQVNFESKL